MINIQIRNEFLLNKKITSFILFSLFCYQTSIFAQEPSYFSITTEEGLPNNNVYVIHQDSIGFLWFATEDGICKYNGSKFEYFDHSILKDNTIIGLHVDVNRRIWFWNMSGQLAYIENNQIHLMQFDKPLGKFKIIAFFIDSKGQFWVSTFKDGVWLYNPKTNKARQIFYDPIYIPIPSIEEDKHGNIYLDYRLKIDTTGKTKVLYKYKFHIKKTAYSERLFIFNRVTWDDLSLKEITEDSVQSMLPLTFESPVGMFTNLYEDKKETIWITTLRLLFGIRKDGQWINNGKPFISKLSINHFFQDQEGNYWLAIKGKGLRMYPSLDILTYTSLNSNLKGESVFSITSNQNKTLLIGQEEGNLSLLKNGKFLHKKINTYTDIVTTTGLKNNNFWVGSNKVIELDEQLKIVSQYDKYLNDPKTLYEDTVTLNRFSGYYQGIYVDSAYQSTFKTVQYKNSINIDRTYAITKDYITDKVWLGKVNGLQYLDNNKVIDFKIDNLEKQPWVSHIIINKNN